MSLRINHLAVLRRCPAEQAALCSGVLGLPLCAAAILSFVSWLCFLPMREDDFLARVSGLSGARARLAAPIFARVVSLGSNTPRPPAQLFVNFQCLEAMSINLFSLSGQDSLVTHVNFIIFTVLFSRMHFLSQRHLWVSSPRFAPYKCRVSLVCRSLFVTPI